MRRDQERVGEPVPVPIPVLEIVYVTHYGSLFVSVTPWGLSRGPLQVYEHVCSTSTGVLCGVSEIMIIWILKYPCPVLSRRIEFSPSEQ